MLPHCRATPHTARDRGVVHCTGDTKDMNKEMNAKDMTAGEWQKGTKLAVRRWGSSGGELKAMNCGALAVTARTLEAGACHSALSHFTFRRPSSSSSVRGHACSFRSGLIRGEACLVSGLRLGDRVTWAGAAPPCEVMDSSER